ncbi:MAG: sigma-70 family RNA polymerase sigma factor [Myxococcales bacterium]|nr:sigma-70 family RNA polymerase sigma factor [Myxococcales bacterium]
MTATKSDAQSDELRQAEAALVDQARRGDQRAFRTLVERYQRRVFSLALGLLKDPDEARDISQEAFLKAHRHLGSFQGTASFYTWLYRITVNLCIDRKRKVGRGSEVELDERLSHRQVGSPADVLATQKLSFNPQRVAQSSELRKRIFAALDKLSEQHRAVLILREVEGLSYKEIADSMDCPEGTVMSRLFHARRQMQELLSDFAEDAEQEGAE